ncbi:radical SAM/SPASM domain-containing protein, partial [Vibrio cholerae]|uniref:radical SAM/SPASM domain-containing protein n=2 Tax=Vibrio cholerae TaxID=666 RepID=UPI0030802C1C
MKLGLINLSLVDGCNLSCRWCDRPDNFSFIELNDLKSIVDKINTEVSFVPLIQVIGSGEAFLHKNIVKAIEIISGIDIPGARVELWTNGTIEKNHAYEELMKLNVLDGICVSFDGYGDKESLEYMRTGAKYEKIISNVAKLVELRNKFESKCQIGVSSILPREGQIPFKHINTDEVKTKYWSIFPDVDNIMFRELHTYNGTFERSGLPIAVNGVIGPCEKAEAGQLVVDTKGGVHPCCNDINHSLLVGNILEDNISNIMFNNK